MRNLRFLSIAALSAFSAGVATTSAHAQATIDGTAEAFYGAARSTQSNPTGYGDSNTGNVVTANGSELDQAFARIQGGILYLTLSGNLETNNNPLELFFDTRTGGQNVLTGNTDAVGNLNGLTFDTGFTADYYITINGGTTGFFVNYSTLTTGGGSVDSYLGSGVAGGGVGGVLTGGTNPFNIRADINNSNVAGVTGAGGTGAGVTTGVEFAIPLSAIGSPVGGFNISAFITGGGHSSLSNQVLGSLPVGTANLGTASAVNFANQAGTQSFSVAAAVPEPSALALLAPGFAALGLIARRRRAA